jgi:hypothetical protein
MLTDADVAAEHVTLLIFLRRPEALETLLEQLLHTSNSINPLPCFFSLLFLTFF